MQIENHMVVPFADDDAQEPPHAHLSYEQLSEILETFDPDWITHFAGDPYRAANHYHRYSPEEWNHEIKHAL